MASPANPARASDGAAAALEKRVAELEWYHTLELAPGIVTPGWFDLRRVVSRIPFPASLVGQRCLDVGTFDGFWAFEMEKRGAAEVVGIDILDPQRWDWPAGSSSATMEVLGRRKAWGAGFELAAEALGSSVRRMELSVYDVDEENVGLFDFIHLGSLLIHLRDPVGALMRLRRICRRTLLVLDNIDLEMTLLHPRRPLGRLDGLGRPWWWKMNLAALVRAVESAGFELVEPPRRVFMPSGAGQQVARPSPRLLLSRAGREAAIVAARGDPHAALHARPS
jgi:tRNA (mo5U34)-methyltransferase